MNIHEIFEKESTTYMICYNNCEITDVTITEKDLKRGDARKQELIKLFKECGYDPDKVDFQPCTDEYAHYHRQHRWFNG